MRFFQTVLLAAILVTLAIIAIDLHRLVSVWDLHSLSHAAFVRTQDLPLESRAQRIERERREIDQSVEDMAAILGATMKRSVPHEPTRPSRPPAH